MNDITKKLLSMISDISGEIKGAFNIREDGGCAGRQSTENVDIIPKVGQPGIDIAAAALQELAKAGVPADNIVSSRPRVNAATQYLSEDEELAGICAADGEGDPKLSERFNKIRRSLCTLENPLWFSHRRASLAKKQHEGRMLALIVRE